MINKLFFAFITVVALAVASANAAVTGELGILDVSGINPATGQTWKAGDQYRLIFVTSASTQATSTDIATYNSFVQGLADAACLGNANWYVVGSTATVDARDNTSTNRYTDGTGEPILLMDGRTVIANNYADLWDGINFIDGGDGNWYGIYLDENSNKKLAIYGRVFTGSFFDGTASKDNEQVLGGSPENEYFVQTGLNYAPHPVSDDNHWILNYRDYSTDWRPVYAISEPLKVQENYPFVNAGHNWITWSGQPVILDPIVVNNDTQVPQRQLICAWTAEPSDGVSITEDGTAADETTTPQAVVTITKPAEAGDAYVVTLMLSVTLDGVVTLTDTVTIDVYDNSCKAAEAAGMQAAYCPADFNKDCVIDVVDLAALAQAWLEDYSLK